MTQEQKERLEEVIVMPLGVISAFITFLPGFIITTIVGIIDLLFIMPISAIINYIKYGEGEAYDLMNTVDWGWIIDPGLHAAYDWQYKRESKRFEKQLELKIKQYNEERAKDPLIGRKVRWFLVPHTITESLPMTDLPIEGAEKGFNKYKLDDGSIMYDKWAKESLIDE